MLKKLIIGLGLVLSLWISFIPPAQATVSSTTNRLTYTCNGTTTVYNYTFTIYEDDDLFVAKQDANNVQTTLTLNSDYTVTGAGGSGGTVVLTAGSKCAAGYTLLLLRRVELTQETDYVEGARISANSLETTLDKQTIMNQQNKEELDRALKVQESSTLTNLNVPVVANRVIGWDSAGTGMTTYGTTVAQSAEIDTLANHGGSLNQALTDIGSGSQTLFCNSATTLTASATIPATLHFIALKGCMITKASTYTLTINGPFEAGLYQVFSGFAAGNVSFSSTSNIKAVHPEWWGLLADDSTDNSVALASAISSAQRGTYPIAIILPSGPIKYSTGIILNAGNAQYMSFRGSAGGIYDPGAGNPTHGTLLKYTGNDIAIKIQSRGVHLADFHLVGTSSANEGIQLGNGVDIAGLHFENITIAGFTATNAAGMMVEAGRIITSSNFYNMAFNNNYVGLDLSNTTLGSLTTFRFYGCTFIGNTRQGLIINKGTDMTFYSPIFQSNGGTAISIALLAGGGAGDIRNINFYHPFFESNANLVSGWDVDINGLSASVRTQSIKIIHPSHNGGGAFLSDNYRLLDTWHTIIDNAWQTGTEGAIPTLSFATNLNNADLQIYGRRIVSKNAAFTANMFEKTYHGTSGGGGITATLPSAVNLKGLNFRFKKIDAGAGAFTIDGSGAETIDGAATYALTAQWDYLEIESDGTNWLIMDRDY